MRTRSSDGLTVAELLGEGLRQPDEEVLRLLGGAPAGDASGEGLVDPGAEVMLESRESEGALLGREVGEKLTGLSNEHTGLAKIGELPISAEGVTRPSRAPEHCRRYRFDGSYGSRAQNPAPLRCSSRTGRVVSRRRSRPNV